MTSADGSTNYLRKEKSISTTSVGWILHFPYEIQGQTDLTVYHAGNTNIFNDMSLINRLHKPQILLLPIDGSEAMGPEEAAYAVKKYFTHAHTLIPMNFPDNVV